MICIGMIVNIWELTYNFWLSRDGELVFGELVFSKERLTKICRKNVDETSRGWIGGSYPGTDETGKGLEV